ncbi:ATP-binding protein [Streptomyces chattanoogensis]|uniref:ATP-binding protein n=1 Tax=Streptomyces chattanoogensis TaxID=66876 RepID=UPI00368178A8
MSTRARLTPATPPPAVAYRLPRDGRSVGWARKELRRHLRARHIDSELAATAELLLSVLVTNAVQAQAAHAPVTATPPIGIRFALSAGRLRLEVQDASNEQPVRNKQVEEDEVCGRGLLLVDALASGWGVVYQGGTGKTTWAEVALGSGGGARHVGQP